MLVLSRRNGCCLSSQHRAPRALIRHRLLRVPSSLSVTLCSFRRTRIPPWASLAPQKPTVGKNHRPTPLGGMVQAALYLDECSQRCYSSVWAYDYTVWMPLWSYGKSRALTANPSSHQIYCALPRFPFFSGWQYHCYVRYDGSIPVPKSPSKEA